MPTPYENLLPYLRPNGLESLSNDSFTGVTAYYRGPTSTITSNKPAIGDDWNGNPVLSVRVIELQAGSARSDLFVTAGQQVTYSGVIGTPEVEQTYYGLRWRPVVKPLEVHPAFQTDGDFDLSAADPTTGNTGYQDIIGWRAEQDPALRSNLQYRPLDSSGQPGAIVDVGENAAIFINLLLKGVEEFVDYLPVWRKRSIYKGSTAPAAGSIGVYEVPGGPIPSAITDDYFFVKSADDVERIGKTSKWRRDEEWEGGVQVFADRDFVYPSGDPTA